MRKLSQIFASEQSLVLTDQMIYSGTTFITTAMLARFLGVEIFGWFSSFVLMIYLLLSMSNAMVIMPLQVAISKFKDIKEYHSFAFLLQLLISLLIFSCFFVVFKLDLLPILASTGMEVGLFAAVFLIYDFLRKLFLAKQKIKKAIWIDLSMSISQISGIFILQNQELLNLNTTIIVMSFSYLIPVIMGLGLADLSVKHLNIKREYLNYHLKEGTTLLLSSVLQWGSSNLFVISSGMFLGVAALGAFRLVQSMFGVLNLLLQTFENYTLPKVAKMYTESISKSKEYLRNISSKGFILFLIILTPLFLFSKEAIYVFGGEDFLPFHFIVKGMVLLYVVIYLGYSARLPIRILMLNKSFTIGYAISFLFSLISFQFLLSQYGISGAIVGLIINQLLMITYWHTQLIKEKFSLWTP